MTGKLRALVGVALLACLGPGCGCRTPDDPFDDAVRALAAGPAGDAPWRAALSAARSDDGRLSTLLDLAERLEAEQPDRWENSWGHGEVLLRLGRAPDSAATYREALRRARVAADPVGIACSANRLAVRVQKTGELDLARALLDEALESAVQAERQDLETFVRNNLAGLLQFRGDYAAARDELELIEAGLRKLGNREAAVGVAYNRGALLVVLGDAVGARQQLERAYEAAVEIGDAWTVDASALLLGRVHRLTGDLDAADSWFERVGTESDELRTVAEMELGRVALDRGQFERAIERLESAAGRARRSNPVYTTLAETMRADAELRAGRIAEGTRRLETLIQEPEDDRPGYSAWMARSVLARERARTGQLDEAVRLLEEATAVVGDQGATLDPTGEGMHFLRERADVYANLAVALVRRGPDSTELHDRLLRLSHQVKARALRRLRGGNPGDRPARVTAIQTALAPGVALLDYLVGEDQGVVLAVDRLRSTAALVPGRKAIAASLARYQGALNPRSLPDPRSSISDEALDAGQLLAQALLEPVRPVVDTASRLYVAPSPELALVPFEALPWNPGDREATGRSYLHEHTETALLPMAGPPRASRRGRASSVLLAGAPLFGDDSPWPEIPWSAYELSKLDRMWGDTATSIVEADLTLDGLLTRPLARFDVMHFATHAVASTRDPRRCGVVLSGGETLGLDRIRDLQLGEPLVVLSACRTAEGELLPGEGVVGLTWAFLSAGARGVVASRWTLADRTAAELMLGVHARFHDGVEPVRALAEARRELARRVPHPAFWAPFVLVIAPEPLPQAAPDGRMVRR